MMKRLILFFSLALCAFGQAQQIRWAATTGDVSISAAYAATIQQPATNASQVYIDQIVVYCSAACTVSQAANGTAATATAGTVTPILPTQLNTTVPVNFWTASNVGSGTAQGGAVHIFAGDTKILCLSPSCGNPAQVILGTGGTAVNYTLSIASVTGTVNITFLGRTQ